MRAADRALRPFKPAADLQGQASRHAASGLARGAKVRDLGAHDRGLVERARLAHHASVRSFERSRCCAALGDARGTYVWECLGWLQHNAALARLRALPPNCWVLL